ncbi:MAG: stage II sporulation protein M [Methanoregula sp.]|jgi:stage II sporulation protein M|uniref:stage II sporulation protein M n=1 Tax=Methanoregula sp. TaxID=2052170 RepID=UPI0025F3D880|nr:stage II sporulation protein M [Methanoregula sp.]MCK9632486.1 stage II sporulation protein M [Methanoregula sp.]
MSNSPLANALIIILLLFMTTMCVGWIGSAQNPAVGEQLMELFEKEVAGQFSTGDTLDMCVKLFLNNLGACILLFLGGASFGILTIFIMSLNGIVIGAIMEIVHETHSALFVAAALVPHGIFEIPAFIIAGALGVLLAQSLIAEWYGETDTGAEVTRFARLFILYVLPLVAIAACVEAFITPVVISLVA